MSAPRHDASLAARLAEVLARPDVWRGELANAPRPAVPTGFAELDRELPGGGWPRGALTEVLLDGAGLGEISLLVPALARIRAEGGWSLVVAPPHPLHAPAWAAAGVDLARLAVVSPAQERDALWAAEQALASGAPRAVLCWARQADARAVRRLQVAAGAGALAILFRPLSALREASAAPLRLTLSAGGAGALAVSVVKRRGPAQGAPVQLALPRPVRWRPHELAAPRTALARGPFAAPAARSAADTAIA